LLFRILKLLKKWNIFRRKDEKKFDETREIKDNINEYYHSFGGIVQSQIRKESCMKKISVISLLSIFLIVIQIFVSGCGNESRQSNKGYGKPESDDVVTVSQDNIVEFARKATQALWNCDSETLSKMSADPMALENIAWNKIATIPYTDRLNEFKKGKAIRKGELRVGLVKTKDGYYIQKLVIEEIDVAMYPNRGSLAKKYGVICIADESISWWNDSKVYEPIK